MTGRIKDETLKDLLAREPGGLDADVALKIADGLLAALAILHAAGRAQGALTSGNVLLCRDDSIRLTGAAASSDRRAPEFADPAFSGTPTSDVFAAGIVLHEALTGQDPFASGTLRIKSVVRRILSHADEVLLKALAEKPADRYPDAAAFRAALRQIRYREVRSSTDSYRLLRLVGEGGFGCVYRAWAREAGRFVAVKQLKRPEYGDRFRREAHIMRKIDDPAFVRLVDYFETEDVGGIGSFLVMDFLPGMPGSSLRDAIRRAGGAPLPLSDVILAFERYARALARLHGLGIFHRDIKPSNLYFPSEDPAHAAIMDLGIARDVSGTATQGQVPGTLDYMPPEVVLGGSRGDAGMDIYALGLSLYEAVSGRTGYPRLPTGSQAFSAFYERVKTQRPPVFDSPEVRDRPMLLALLRDMTALNPVARLQDAELLRRRLMAVRAENPGTDSEPSDFSDDEAPTGVTAVGGERVQPISERSVLRWMDDRRLWILAGAVATFFALVAAWGPVQRGIAAFRFRKPVVTSPLTVDREEDGTERNSRGVADAVREQRAILVELAENRMAASDCADRIAAWKDRWRGVIDPVSYSAMERELFEAEVARINREANANRSEPERPEAGKRPSVPAERVPVRPPRAPSSGPTGPAFETKAVLAAFPQGVVCQIDGVLRQQGEVELPRGQHVVRYGRPEETYPGVKDYEPKEYEFTTHLSGPVPVPVPTGEWVRSAAFVRARERADLVVRGREIQSGCRRLLAPEPLETRRRRLEEVHALLSDWKTPSALAALGPEVERTLRASYEAERTRTRGYVRNATALAVRVTTDGVPVEVPPGGRALVTFERRWPEDARVVIPGYEFVMLPREASAFDGRTFVVSSSRLVKVGAWEDPKEREKRSILDDFRDATDAGRRREIEDLKRAIELRKKIEGKTGESDR